MTCRIHGTQWTLDGRCPEHLGRSPEQEREDEALERVMDQVDEIQQK